MLSDAKTTITLLAPYSPEICFSPDEKIFFIRGISSPEDVRGTYYPVIDWFRQYIDSLLAGNSKPLFKYSTTEVSG